MANGLWTTVIFLGAVLLNAGPVLAQERDHPAAGLPVPRSSLTLEEQARALGIAVPERRVLSPLALTPEARRADAAPHFVVSNLEAVDAKDESRLALVTLYEYGSGVTVQRLVDLEAGRVVAEERADNVSAPLAEVERDYAKALTLADERVARLLAPHPSVNVEFLLTLTTERDQELFGRRIVAALFRTPRGYLEHPEVFVDLTGGRVIVRGR
jgi:hypothetical protein